MDLVTSHLQLLLPIEQFPLLQGNDYTCTQTIFKDCVKALTRGDIWLGNPYTHPTIGDLWECYCPQHQYTKKDFAGMWKHDFNPWVCHYCGRRMLIVYARFALPHQ
jgi:hypothetical protein